MLETLSHAQWGWLYYTVIATCCTAPGSQGLPPEVQHDEIFLSAALQSFNWVDVVSNHVKKQITLEKRIYFFISSSSTEIIKWSQTGHLSCHFSSQVTSLKLPGPARVPSHLFFEVKLQVIKTSTWVASSLVTIFSHNDALMWQLNEFTLNKSTKGLHLSIVGGESTLNAYTVTWKLYMIITKWRDCGEKCQSGALLWCSALSWLVAIL